MRTSGRNHAAYQDQVQKTTDSIRLNCQGRFRDLIKVQEIRKSVKEDNFLPTLPIDSVKYLDKVKYWLRQVVSL